VKTLGLIGGTGWVSTLEYYRLLNEEVNRRLGGYEAVRCILYSLNFGDVMRLKAEDPEQSGVRALVVQAARTLTTAGADGLVLCANTLHWFAADVQAATPVPVVHIARATGARIRAHGLDRVGLLGTLPTMERDFYRAVLSEMGITVLTPDEADRRYVHDAIYEELVKGQFLAETRARFLQIIDRLRERGASGIVLGCTEIPLLIKPEECALPLFDTLRIHADAAVDFALADEPAG
jgi:aspartate racemase